jgi:hypothetical protein
MSAKKNDHDDRRMLAARLLKTGGKCLQQDFFRLAANEHSKTA